MIYKIYKNKKIRNETVKAIEQEKIISIIRKPEKESFKDTVNALYNGGIRLIEITFDRENNFKKEETCEMISTVKENFKDMLVGAGTVTRKKEVFLAFKAGASFIISPNCDPKIIRLTKKLGMVSIPAAYTPTEIALALNNGADYIKLFPATEVTKEYISAVTAPLSDARLLAVGGVTENNAGDFIKKGFCGIGVGSNLYSKKLIENQDFKGLTYLAEKFKNALK